MKRERKRETERERKSKEFTPVVTEKMKHIAEKKRGRHVSQNSECHNVPLRSPSEDLNRFSERKRGCFSADLCERNRKIKRQEDATCLIFRTLFGKANT